MIESILKEIIQIEDGDAKSAKLEGVIRNLEVERGKIEVFQRELPLSVILLSDVVELLKEELERCKKGPVFEELMPMESKFEENRGTEVQNDAKDKMNWMSSVQLWSHNNGDREQNNDNKIEKKPAQESTSGAVLQFETFSGAEMNNHNNIISYTSTNGLIVNNPNRKTRRSWSPELHRLFISSLQKLGGAQVATPKQIRELMKVDGLTNDEVKSHLQKYRLHCRKDKEHYTSSQQSTSQSGSPTGHLQFIIRTGGKSNSSTGQFQFNVRTGEQQVSYTNGESCEIDESESYGFK